MSITLNHIEKVVFKGLQVMDEDDWEEILSMSKPVRGYKASTRSKNKDSAQVSDSDDEDYNPSTKTRTIPKVRKKVRRKTMSRCLIYLPLF